MLLNAINIAYYTLMRIEYLVESIFESKYKYGRCKDIFRTFGNGIFWIYINKEGQAVNQVRTPLKDLFKTYVNLDITYLRSRHIESNN